MLRIC